MLVQSARRRRGLRRTSFDPKEKVRREQHGLNRGGQSFFKRAAVLLHGADQVRQLIDFHSRDRTAISSMNQMLDNHPSTRARVLTMQVTTNINTFGTPGGRALRN